VSKPVQALPFKAASENTTGRTARGFYRAADAGALTAGAGNRFGDIFKGGACGTTGKNKGPFCPQPESAAALVKTTAKPCLLASAARRPKIRCEKTMTGL